MLIAHKIELNPNNTQATYFAKCAGVARVAYNWALHNWKLQYEEGTKPNEAKLRTQLNGIKSTEFPYMAEVTKNAPQQAIKDLGSAFKHFFRRVKKANPGQKVGYPKFKKKGIHDSFRADNGPTTKGANAVEIDGKRIKLAKVGWVRLCESSRFSGQIKQANISKRAGKWFVALLIDTTDVEPKTVHENQGTVVGVDLGCSELAVLSTGERIVGPKPHKALLSCLRRLNKALSRKVKGSSNRKKAKAKLARLHYRIANIRNDALHKLTTSLCKRFNVIVIEDLNVRGMVRNHRLARSVMDQAFYKFRRQLVYKAGLTGTEVVVADRWYPSTKTCSDCGQIHEMPLSKREMDCECGLSIDRDLNAAINLRDLAANSAATACGEVGSGKSFRWPVKPTSAKQENSIKHAKMVC